MKKMMNWLKNEESGQGMVEYALIIASIDVTSYAYFSSVVCLKVE